MSPATLTESQLGFLICLAYVGGLLTGMGLMWLESRSLVCSRGADGVGHLLHTMTQDDNIDYVYGDEVAERIPCPVTRQLHQMQKRLDALQRSVERCGSQIETPDWP